ncbi:MAG: hypothetical protein ACK6DC_13745 [Planctomycetota bacterium]|jgi:predicted metal-dependent hydrolase
MTSEAKELFLSFKGSKSSMMRNDLLDSYESFLVTPEEESIWASQAIDEWIMEFDLVLVANEKFYAAIELIKNTNCFDRLLDVLKVIRERISQLDTFTCLLLCESLLELFNWNASRKAEVIRPHIGGDVRRELSDVISKLVEAIGKSEISVAKYYTDNIRLARATSLQAIKERYKRLKENSNLASVT